MTKPQTVQIVRNRFTWCFSTLENRSLWAKARQRRTGLKLIHYISTIHQEIDPTCAKLPLPISLANILNFLNTVSHQIPSFLPPPTRGQATAGIHRKTWETLIWKTVAKFQKWIPACAGMTATGTATVQIPCPDVAFLTKGRLKTQNMLFRRPLPSLLNPSAKNC